jgi:ABC-type proline/glycine betaine transport system permease subunit
MSEKLPLSTSSDVDVPRLTPALHLDTFRLLEAVAPPLGFARQGHWFGYWITLGIDLVALKQGAAGMMLVAVLLAVAGRILGTWALAGARRVSASDAVTMAPIPRVPALVYLLALLLQVLDLWNPKAHVRFASFPESPATLRWIESAIDAGVQWLTVHFAATFDGLTHAMNAVLGTLEAALSAVPWPIAILLLTFLAWRKGGIPLVVLTASALLYFGVFGYWSKTVTTAALVCAAFVACIIVGIPIGVIAAKNRKVKALVMPCLDVMQTMPSFVYLLPAVAFFSIGKPPALVATVIFALPPLIRLTCLGLEQVPLVVQEAMYAHGASPWQTLVKAELPLAAPSIRAGINQAIMMSLSMVVIAALIGGGGLGYDVLFALQNVQYGRGIMAGLAIVFCAILFDRLVKDQRKQLNKLP